MCMYLSRSAMGDILSPFLAGYLHLPAGDAGSRHRGPQQVAVLIDGAGLQRRPDELLHKLHSQVLDEHLPYGSGSKEEWSLRGY